MIRLLSFLLPLPFFAVCGAMIALNGIFGGLEPESIDRHTLVRVMQLRDFRQFSPDFIERMTDRAEQEFGRQSPNKPKFELPFLEKEVHVYFQTHRSNRQSYLEINMILMAKVRYYQWMYEYQSAASARKAALMHDIVEDMRYWQNVYLDYVRFLEQPEPTPAELLRDFQRMIEEFKTAASPEEVQLIDSFAKRMTWALAAAEARNLLSLPK